MLQVTRQILELLWVGLRSLPARMATTSVIIIGVGGVAVVLLMLLAMAQGFEEKLAQTGRADRAIVLRAGSTSEVNGNIPLDNHRIAQNLQQVKRAGSLPLMSRETYVSVNLPLRQAPENEQRQVTASAGLRGVNAMSYQVRPELTFIAGRKPKAGKFELLVGNTAKRLFANLEPGNSLRFRGIEWQVVGTFAAPASAMEAELWTDERLLALTWNRGETFSSALVQLTDADHFENFNQALADDPRLIAQAIRETDYYAAQAQNTTGLMRGMALLLGGIMSLGAFFAAVTTMYAAISQRSLEIASLRAIGFSNRVVVTALMLEAALLSLVGALLAVVLVTTVLSGQTFTTGAATTANIVQVAFSLKLTWPMVLGTLALSLALGLLGGLPPAISACQKSIAIALRHVG